ncbi:alkane 1-monooxygenase [uncultured Tenacibaculum sp.]|uniref:alkane 1-monooxygenase n=1 Tax=uncultured Tenacibaculum sp. TaxID=174713 RepID=UPI0026275B63|nr:alkane 1-monooxygenase [uncultured Tenacibaculum sp.]
MKALKFLSILILPITVYISFTNNGWLTVLPLITFFGFVPLLELLFKPDKENFEKEQEKAEKENKLYTYILYLTIPIQLIFLVWFFYIIQEPELTTLDYIGKISAMGLMCGVIGLNVGHELGHRNNRFDEFLGEILLLTSLNTHFLPYHNAGHHLNVATPKDAATARKNEILYSFWIRSHFQSYYQAWEAENKRMKNLNRNWFHHQNRMLVYTFCNFILIFSIFFFFNLNVLLTFLAAAVFGILLLETVNYIEHYGLLRKKNEKGRYERVKRTHSWNSDHVIGKIMLFNLSRHSDHHYNGSKHYQILKSLPESPQMPTGYPGMMLVALFPPLWFKLMNKKLQEI